MRHEATQQTVSGDRSHEWRPNQDGPISLRAALQASQRDLSSLQNGLARLGEGDAPQSREQMREHLIRMMTLIERLLAMVERPVGLQLATLSREADHRVRNSLQTVIGFLHRQASQTPLDEVRDALKLASARVYAVAQLHAALAATSGDSGKGEGGLDLATYAADLGLALNEALIAPASMHLLQIDLDRCVVLPEIAQQVGIIVTEPVSNAISHAFPNVRSGIVRVVGAHCPDGGYQVCVQDNGKGLPSSFDLRLRPSGLGLRVVTMAADRIHARLTMGRPSANVSGACFTLTLAPGDIVAI